MAPRHQPQKPSTARMRARCADADSWAGKAVVAMAVVMLVALVGHTLQANKVLSTPLHTHRRRSASHQLQQQRKPPFATPTSAPAAAAAAAAIAAAAAAPIDDAGKTPVQNRATMRRSLLPRAVTPPPGWTGPLDEFHAATAVAGMQPPGAPLLNRCHTSHKA